MKAELKPEELRDTYWKCFLMETASNSVYGLVSENNNVVAFQWLGNAGHGKFYVMSTHYERKEVFGNRMFEVTLDYQEAYNHLIRKRTNL